MDDIDLMKHIKDLTSDSMKVFITEPIALEKQVRYIPFTANSRRSFVMEKDGRTQLSGFGSSYGHFALDNLIQMAKFYVANRERFKSLFHKYREEYERITRAYEIVKERRHQATGWHDRAILIRQQFELDAQIKGLFEKMYQAQFGKDAPRMDRKIFEQLKNVEQNK